MEPLDTEDLCQASGGRKPRPPKEMEIHKVDEHTGADCIVKLSDSDLQGVNGGIDLSGFGIDMELDPNDIQNKQTMRNSFTI